MKTTFYIRLAKTFTSSTKILFLALSLFIFNSCKKELLNSEIEDEIVKSQIGAPSINPISYSDFLKKVNINKIGKIGKVFSTNPKGLTVNNDVLKDENLGLELEISNIKELKSKEHVSYVFPIKLSSKYAQNFSNLTIDIKGDTVRVFVNTYKPTLEWIKNWKQKRAGVFIGDVSYTALNGFAPSSSKGNKNSVMSGLTCTYWEEVYEIPYQCKGVPYCWPGNPDCYWNGTANAAGYRTEVHSKMECTLPGAGGGGEGSGTSGGDNSGGGGGITTPNTPYGYEPCDQPPSRPNPDVPPCEAPTMAENLISILGITVQSQIDFLNNPTPARALLVQQMNSYLWVNQGSLESQEFLNWALAFVMENSDVGFSELVEMNSIPNSTITLPNIIDVTDLTPYPAFKSIVENLPAFLNQNPEVLKSLSRYTGFSKTKIMQLMQPGKGPKIELVSNLVNEHGQPCIGQYTPGTYFLKIKKELVVGLDKVQSPKRYGALGMLLCIVTLHEFVHYGRDVNKMTRKITLNGWEYDVGVLFEFNISPPYLYDKITRNNAIHWANFYNFNIND